MCVCYNPMSFKQAHSQKTVPRSCVSPTWNPSCPWPSVSRSSGSVARWELFGSLQGTLGRHDDLTMKNGDFMGFSSQKW